MSNKTFIIKRWGYHLAFWIICLAALVVEDQFYHPNLTGNIRDNGISILFYIPLIYFNIYKLIPRYLHQKRYLAYGFFSLVLIAVTIFIICQVLSTVFDNIYYNSVRAFITLLSDVVIIYIFTTVLAFLQIYYRTQVALKELRHKNVESELNLLKSQVNPHFLFNTLNSIYVLISRKPNVAQETVLKLSELLSHQLYDNYYDRIDLVKEIKNLQNYIQLEMVRHQDSIELTSQFPENLNGEKIAPMLLLPLVENAFKHGNNSATGKCNISCVITLRDHKLEFYCQNTIMLPGAIKGSGIGQYNVRRRLELLYPQSHSFTTEVQNNIHKVHLKIDLDEY